MTGQYKVMVQWPVCNVTRNWILEQFLIFNKNGEVIDVQKRILMSQYKYNKPCSSG
jgi:hypothetical protein